jgi:hypothetical protein
MAERNPNSALFTALASGIAGLGLGAAVGAWWGRRIPGHIYRDGDDWYVDEPVRRELQRRIPKSAGPAQNDRDTFSLFGHGSIRLAPTQITLPAQSGPLYAVQPMLRPGQTLEWVMLDLAVHRVGTLKLIRYTPRRVEGRMVQGPNPEEPAPQSLDT